MIIMIRRVASWACRSQSAPYAPIAKRPDTGSVATAVMSRWYRMVFSKSACQSMASERSRDRSGNVLTACEANMFGYAAAQRDESSLRTQYKGVGWVTRATYDERRIAGGMRGYQQDVLGGGRVDTGQDKVERRPRVDPRELQVGDRRRVRALSISGSSHSPRIPAQSVSSEL